MSKVHGMAMGFFCVPAGNPPKQSAGRRFPFDLIRFCLIPFRPKWLIRFLKAHKT